MVIVIIRSNHHLYKKFEFPLCRKMLSLLLKPLVKRSRIISVCLASTEIMLKPSYFFSLKIKKNVCLASFKAHLCYFAQH